MVSNWSSVNLPHCSRTRPLSCFQLPSMRSQFMASPGLIEMVGRPTFRAGKKIPAWCHLRLRLGADLSAEGRNQKMDSTDSNVGDFLHRFAARVRIGRRRERPSPLPSDNAAAQCKSYDLKRSEHEQARGSLPASAA